MHLESFYFFGFEFWGILFSGFEFRAILFFWVVEICSWTSIPVKEMLVCPPPPGSNITRCVSMLVNQSITQGVFPDSAKIASVIPVFKKEDPLDKGNYRPISILSVFSKVFEKYYLSQPRPYCGKVMSHYLSAYRPNFCTQHVLLRLIEKWRNFLNCNKVVGAVMMDLSKAFDCLPHDH